MEGNVLMNIQFYVGSSAGLLLILLIPPRAKYLCLMCRLELFLPFLLLLRWLLLCQSCGGRQVMVAVIPSHHHIKPVRAPGRQRTAVLSTATAS